MKKQRSTAGAAGAVASIVVVASANPIVTMKGAVGIAVVKAVAEVTAMVVTVDTVGMAEAMIVATTKI